MPTFAASKAGYGNLWRSMTVTRRADASRAAAGMIGDKGRFQVIEDATGVPWFWIAIVAEREGNGFGGYLGNGERIIGTNKKTRLVPKNRGPFASWNDGAIDSLEYKKLDKIDDWPVERLLYEFERWNGWGYGKGALGSRAINSPYVWAGTSLYGTAPNIGKYVADHKFDSRHIDKQLGAAALLKQLAGADMSVAERISGEPRTTPDAPEEKEMTIPELIAQLKAVTGAKSVLLEW